MGLCKCPKKVVTTLFCYEHRVNVCENCLVSNHPSCIIQSYYKWLQDSDYDSKCPLCSEDLSIRECVRLMCFHVFHWKCFERAFDGYPQTTAPAGYKCPTCAMAIFPNPQTVSPVAEALRSKLVSAGWWNNAGMAGLSSKEDQQGKWGGHQQDLVEAASLHIEPLLHVDPMPPRCARTSFDFDPTFKQLRNPKVVSPAPLYTIEEDATKYRRRRPMTLQQSLTYLRRSPYGKFICLIASTLFVLCVLFVTVIPKEFEDERAFNRIIELKERAEESWTKMEVIGKQ